MHLRLSHEIRNLARTFAYQPLTLAALLSETAERGTYLVIGLLVAPFLIPLPPGLAPFLGSACLLLSLQMAVGRRSPWLPKRLLAFKFPKFLVRQLLHDLQRLARLVERFVCPRWPRFATHTHIRQINGGCIAWLTVLLLCPIPFTNAIPAFGILVLVVAMLETDGLLLCLSYGLMTLITALFGLIFYLLWRSPLLLGQWF
ncbi:MAG: exopolysaccharide biosynthesis protein [Synechococcales bacterium]|nr:exopolysaccharide biosynthesis protein [Synechococcales bacterium]